MLFLLSSAGFVGFFVHRLQIRLPIAIYLHVAVTVLWLYLGGLLGVLRVATGIAVFAGLILLALALRRAYQQRHIFTWRSWTPAQWAQLLYLLPFAVLPALIPDDFKFTGWDEFSFWALGAKVIFSTHALYQEDSPIVAIFKAYPPAQQLFQYYYLFMRSWSESGLLAAQTIFMLAGLSCVIGAFQQRASLVEVPAFLAICTFPFLFGFDYLHIYVDPLLGAAFAASVALAMTARGWKGALLVAISLALLILIKQVGLILALLVITVYFFSACLRAPALGQGIRTAAMQSAPGIFAMGFAFASWSWYVKKIGIAMAPALPTLQSMFVEPMLGRIGLTALEFLRRFQAPVWNIGVLMSPGMVLLGLIAASACTALLAGRREILSRSAAFALIALGAAGYLLFLFLSYLLFFSEYEGVRVASFERYAASYFLAWAVVIVGAYAGAIASFSFARLRPVLAIPILAMMLILPWESFLPLPATPESRAAIGQRETIDALAETVLKQAGKGDKVYFIDQNSTGYEKFMFGYSVAPLGIQWWCWSLGEKYNKDDVWTCDKPLSEVLDGYSYLVLYNADEQFWRNNSELFAVEGRGQTSGVYKIQRTSGTASIQRLD